MKKSVPFLFVLFLILSMYSSCYYDSEQALYPNNTQPCDTAHVTYELTIAPIMSANCNVCHNKAILSGGIVTDNWLDLNNVALQQDSTRLLRAVFQTGPIKMPKGGNKLPDCDLAKIRIWVQQGAPNN